eukprot:TRINITY_DN4732_c0_g1_i3.p1 TRINITY_DN4732_c0_g1~~TRINITY_DN4732_c0_g1_i3.p1  ORF type:complete len:104 (+),score=19.55 TRINITY_DN4732_c0_g1_i3:419-730(+)
MLVRIIVDSKLLMILEKNAETLSANDFIDDVDGALADYVNINESRFGSALVSDEVINENRFVTIAYNVSDGTNPDEFGPSAASSFSGMVAFQALALFVANITC